ncbi:hypothetical protein D3C81_1121060 [compost metagenome]
MIHSEPATTITRISPVNSSAITLLRCSDDVSRCRKYFRWTRIWTAAMPRMIHRIVPLSMLPSITSLNGITVRITARMKPIA